MDHDLYRGIVSFLTDNTKDPDQYSARCVDGPLEGGHYALIAGARQGEVVGIGPWNRYPYRAIQEEGTAVWYYVYADSIDDFPLQEADPEYPHD